MTFLSLILSVITFSHFSMQEGLSQNSVFSITQDNNRYMWFATYEGINRFDGYNFTAYYPLRDPDFAQVEGADPLVYADSKGRIWAYDGGLSRYNPEEDKFVLVKDRPHGPITSLVEVPGGRMLVAAGGEITALDIESGQRLNIPEFFSGSDAVVMDYNHGILAVGTMSGKIAAYKVEGTTPISMATFFFGSRIKDVHVVSENEIWAAVSEGKIVRCNLNNGSLREYPNGSSFQPSSFGIGVDRTGRVLVFAKSMIYAYDSQTEDFKPIFSIPDHPFTLKKIFIDADNDVWLGSYYKGIYYFHTEESPLEVIDFGLPSDNLQICNVAESTEGQIWICTHDKGTWIYDPATRRVHSTQLNLDPNKTGAKDMYFSPDGKMLWCGLGNGFSEYNRVSGQHTLYSGGIYPRAVYSIIAAGENELWLGTLSGVYIFNTVTKDVRKVATSGELFIYKLFADEQDNLWVASESGLYHAKITRDGQTDCGIFEREGSVRDVHDILYNSDELIIASRSGLYIRNSEGIWSHYDKNSGFSSNFMNGVEMDCFGALWVGTEYGLNRFNATTGEFSRYFKDDGAGMDYYTKNAHCAASDGSLYFGGIGGLVRIQPSGIHIAQESSSPRITDFIVNGGRRSAKNNVLSFKENSVSFRFSVTNYSSLKKNVFRYRLWGVDEDWKITDNPFSDTYASLRPGKYRFELFSYNVRGAESDNSASYSFVVRPPWYASITAIFTYCLLVMTLMGFMIWRINIVYKKRAQEEIERNAAFSQAGIDRLTVLHYTGDPVSPEDAEFILKAVKTMQNHISDETYAVEQLADELCMSRSNLYLKIKKLTGESALQFVHKIRMEKACELLRSTELPISEIAQKTGFGSSAYFCTCFKREKGITPTQWR